VIKTKKIAHKIGISKATLSENSEFRLKLKNVSSIAVFEVKMRAEKDKTGK
jgi:hypothetical protein